MVGGGEGGEGGGRERKRGKWDLEYIHKIYFSIVNDIKMHATQTKALTAVTITVTAVLSHTIPSDHPANCAGTAGPLACFQAAFHITIYHFI